MSTNVQVFKKILARNVILPVVLGIFNCAVFAGMVSYLMSANQWLRHTDQVIAQAESLQKIFIDAETGMRGYLMTHDETFLDPYYNTLNNWKRERDKLRSLSKDNPVQTDRCDDLTNRFEAWIRYAEDLMKNSREARPSEIVRIMKANKSNMDDIRGVFHDFISTELSLREQRSDEAHSFVSTFLVVVIILTLLSALFLSLWGRRQLITLSTAYEGVLDETSRQNEVLLRDQWIKGNENHLSEKIMGRTSLAELCEQALSFILEISGAEAGILYAADENASYLKIASLGTAKEENPFREKFTGDETLLGRAIRGKKAVLYSDLPAHYLNIASGLGETSAQHVLILPIRAEKEVNAVIELGFLKPVDDKIPEFMNLVGEKIGVAIQNVKYRERLENLLHEVQVQSEELQAQQEELRVSNEELDNQAKLLKEAQMRTEEQNVELEQTNEQLVAQAKVLEEQRDQIEGRNHELLETRREIEAKADELQKASQYKSEFLANMSHELRTPLNSSLILAQLLTENRDGNLTEQQVNFARQIVKSGNDLLILINDILDLSKVESGLLQIAPEEFPLKTLVHEVERTFSVMAKNKGIEFRILCDNPEQRVYSDSLRIEQVVKNLVSNALKFTQKGFVEVRLRVDAQAKDPARALCIAVQDTGIGIKDGHRGIIFEAFKQADGTTSRNFGGTGLGLSISQNLAKLLGGTIEVQSEFGKGSTFYFYLPLKYDPSRVEIAPTPSPLMTRKEKKGPSHAPAATASTGSATSTASGPEILSDRKNKERAFFIEDDRKDLRPDAKVILIIEDDPQFAMIIRDLAREMSFKAVVASTAEEGIELAEHYRPLAVVLDMVLPDENGLFVLDQLKQRSGTRHIPVHMVSVENFAAQALGLGAIGYMLKPVKREELKTALQKLETKARENIKKVLIIEDDETQNEAIRHLIGGEGVRMISVQNGEDALKSIAENQFDCIVLDLTLPDMSGLSLLETLSANTGKTYPPVIVYTGRDLSKEEEYKIRQFSKSIIIKGVKSPERLLDQVTLFLHQVESKLPPDQQKILSSIRNRDQAIESKRILLVDDDLRNVFALTAALEQRGAQVVMAKNGRDALDILEKDQKFDLVLMDIMMPVMDGYEAIHEMRHRNDLKKIPVIALTAKAMKDDRERALKAGADDYMAKPVDMEKLLSLIRVWTS